VVPAVVGAFRRASQGHSIRSLVTVQVLNSLVTLRIATFVAFVQEVL